MGERGVSDVMQVIDAARDAITVRRVYGDAYDKDGVTFIPAARVAGGGGGGGGEGTDEAGSTGGGSGGGFGVRAHPAGAFVIRDGEVEWKPAVDVNRIMLVRMLVLGLALVVVRSIALRRL
jgi:uncharacterized spore protein YtfJ